MPLFISEEEFQRCSGDAGLVAEKADVFIRELYSQIETVKAEADAASITFEQTCSLIEQKYVSLSAEHSSLQSQHSELNSSLEQRASELGQLQSEKQQLLLQSIEKDGEIERLKREASELHKSKRQLMELLEQKDLEVSEKNATIKSYLDKIVNLTENAASKEARVADLESELDDCRLHLPALCRVHMHVVHLSVFPFSSPTFSNADNLSEKELLERHNTWLNEELTAKVDSLIQLHKAHGELEADMTSKLADVENKFKESSSSLKLHKDRARELEEKLASTERELLSTKDAAAATEERFSAEIATVSKLVDLYKESSEEWSKKATELEGVIKALETHLNQVESEYKDRLEKEESARKEVEKESAGLKEKLQTTAAELETLRKENELQLLPLSSFTTASWVNSVNTDAMGEDDRAIVPRIPSGFSGTALAASLLRDGWSLAKMYSKYQEAVDALRHEQLGRKQTQAILERVLYEIEEKAGVIMDEREEHERLVEAYSALNEKLQHSLSEHSTLQTTIQELKASLKRQERDYVVAQKEIADLQKQVAVLLKECRDVQLRCGSTARYNDDELITGPAVPLNAESNTENIISERLDKYEKELQKHTEEAASKVNAVLLRAEEQTTMIESLHGAVAMYKKLYEEEHKLRGHASHPQEAVPERGSMEIMPLRAIRSDTSREVQEQALERLKNLEEDLAKSRQREEHNGLIARNVEFSQLVVDYQRKLRESAESVSILKHEKEILQNSEKRASDEVRSLSERVHRLQASLDTIQSTEEVREEARAIERRKQEEYIHKIEREWAEAKRELQEERDNVRNLTLERESTLKNALRQVEELSKELASALQSVAVAESKAAVAEARCSDLEKIMESGRMKDPDGADGPSLSTEKMLANFRDEIEKLRGEAQASKDHMLQADEVKRSLEAELHSLRERITELESECKLKTEEAISATAGKEEALAGALSEIATLKDDCSVKMSQIVVMESRISALKEDLEREHQRWRSAQDNYERQVILQSETIQELTKTSQALASAQEETTELRKVVDALKTENIDLKSKWETEKLAIEVYKNEADKKYSEVNELNKILHSRLEALHIRLAEKERGIASGSSSQSFADDDGLQNVVNYLRRTKEIAETEISLLKQEKLRLQSQLEVALKSAENAQTSLNTERAKARASLFTDDEFKSLQLQVRELTLLRESNVQLREENRHNFEECQKLREALQNVRIETENLEKLLRDRDTELEGYRKEIEILKMEKVHLEKRIDELVEKCNNVDLDDYNRLKESFQQIQVNLRERDSQLEETKKLLSEKQDAISLLERDLARSRTELNERETRINEILQAEASLKSEAEKMRRLSIQARRKSEQLLKEKEETSKEMQALSKQLEEARQVKRNTVDPAGEQALREKEKEKDTRIQILEKTLERHREDLKKEKEDHHKEKEKSQKIRKTIIESREIVTQQKTKLSDELKKHKEALKALQDEVEKLKNSGGSQTESTSVGQDFSSTLLEDFASAYYQAVENFEQVAQPACGELDSATIDTPLDNTSSAGAPVGQAVASLTQTPAVSAANIPPTRTNEEKERRLALAKANIKMGRKLVRPSITKPKEPQGDVEMSEADESNIGLSSQNTESQGNVTGPATASARKRPSASVSSDLQDEMLAPEETSSDTPAPLLKKSKASESPQEGSEEPSAAPVKLSEVVPIEESSDDAGNLQQGINKEEHADAEKEDFETAGEQLEEPIMDDQTQAELLSDTGEVAEEKLDKPSETLVSDDQLRDQTEQDIQQIVTESGGEREEGELVADFADNDGDSNVFNEMGASEIGEFQPEQSVERENSPITEPLASASLEAGEIDPSETPEEEKNADMTENMLDSSSKLNDSADPIAETSQVPGSSVATTTDEVSVSTSVDVAGSSEHGGPAPTSSEQGGPAPTADAKPVSPLNSSTTINLQERARQRAHLRQAGLIASSPSRARGRAIRGRGARGGRTPRGQSPS
ncbi:UNVERIFIED_CONTAM: Nuclear-pore anchor [Sesamum radiatum]|uniref:Nuclear-pore anchor n=1 Tax=Sesamum radiatum TaxID=300843 RepID=A0AAW2LRN8_SESRA